jgi:hypothetical protein
LAVSVVVIVVATATPIAPPICWLVLISPDATPAEISRNIAPSSILAPPVRTSFDRFI